MSESASYELLMFLSGIADQLKNTESATGKRIEKKTADGSEYEWVPDPPDKNGLSAVKFINVRIPYWRELGSILERIANGEDARVLFRQHQRTKPKKDGEHRLRALAYWSVRALDPTANDAQAVRLARRIAPAGSTLTPATLRKYAQRHRLRCLLLLSFSSAWVLRFEGSDIRIRLLGKGIFPLLQHLQSKESRDRWRKPPDIKGISDVIFYTPKRADGGVGIAMPAFPGMSITSIDVE